MVRCPFDDSCRARSLHGRPGARGNRCRGHQGSAAQLAFASQRSRFFAKGLCKYRRGASPGAPEQAPEQAGQACHGLIFLLTRGIGPPLSTMDGLQDCQLESKSAPYPCVGTSADNEKSYLSPTAESTAGSSPKDRRPLASATRKWPRARQSRKRVSAGAALNGVARGSPADGSDTLSCDGS